MARRKNDAAQFAAPRCDDCHRDPFYRTIHLLKISDERIAAAHLREEYGKEGEDSGFIKHQLSMRSSYLRNYSGKVDEEGNNIPAWLAFAKTFSIVTRTARGWHFAPKQRRNPSEKEIEENVRYYSREGRIKPNW